MSALYPLPKSSRQDDFVATAGQTVFSSTSFLVFDVADLVVRVKTVGATRFTTLTSGWSATLSPVGIGFATVTLATGRAVGDTVRVVSRRIQDRQSDVTRAGGIQTARLEIENDQFAAVLQEVRRDATEAQETAEDLNDQILAAIAGLFPPASIPGSLLAPGAVVENVGFDLVAYAATRTILKALDTAKAKVAVLTEAGREGVFVWKTGDFTARLALDPQEGVFIKANAVVVSAGAWVRVVVAEILPRWFGATGNGVANDYPALASAEAVAYTLALPLALDVPLAFNTSLTFRCAIRRLPAGRLVPGTAVTITFLDEIENPAGSVFVDLTAAGSNISFDAAIATSSIRAKCIQTFLTMQHFGGEGNYSTDNVQAFLRAWDACQAGGMEFLIPVGRYRFNTAVTALLDRVKYTGLTIRGQGRARSILDFRPAAPGTGVAAFTVKVNSAPKDHTYFKGIDFGVESGHDGPCGQLGDNSFDDPMNLPTLDDVSFRSFANGTSTVGLRLNYVLGGDLKVQATTGATISLGILTGFGVGLQCRQAHFNRIFGSFGTSNIGVHWVGGINQGNTLDTPDIENVNIAMQWEGSAVDNTIIAGTYNYYSVGNSCFGGYGNDIFLPQINPSPPASSANFITGPVASVRVRHGKPANYPVTTPSTWTSGATNTNLSGQDIWIAVWGGVVSSYTVNGFSFGGITAGQHFGFWWRVGDAASIQYSSAPTFRFIN